VTCDPGTAQIWGRPLTTFPRLTVGDRGLTSTTGTTQVHDPVEYNQAYYQAQLLRYVFVPIILYGLTFFRSHFTIPLCPVFVLTIVLITLDPKNSSGCVVLKRTSRMPKRPAKA
jgi:hypothetical protein